MPKVDVPEPPGRFVASEQLPCDVILFEGTVVPPGMTVLTIRYSGALAIDRLCVCTVSIAHLS